MGLYRDDGLAAIRENGQKLDQTRKKINDVFKEAGLKITVEGNVTCTEYLDVFFDLKSGTYRPYRKPNDIPMYIHTKSNHPPIITKQLPRMISHRLSMLSSTEAIFNEECGPYKEALAKSGYKEDLKYTHPQPKSKNTRHRKILWFNPPFNLDVKTNVAAKFLKMVDKNFPKRHRTP